MQKQKHNKKKTKQGISFAALHFRTESSRYAFTTTIRHFFSSVQEFRSRNSGAQFSTGEITGFFYVS